MDLYQNEIESYVMERTKITKKKLDDVRERKIDWNLHCDECIELGIATDIIQ